MNNQHRRAKEKGGQHLQPWNSYPAVDPSANGFESTFDTQSTVSYDFQDLALDIDQSVGSSARLDHPSANVITPPTSFYSNSNFGDASNQFPTPNDSKDWGCSLFNGYAASADGNSSVGIDPQLLFGGPFAPPPSTEPPPTVAPMNYNSSAFSSGNDLMAESFPIQGGPAPEGMPTIRVEGSDGAESMDLWLQNTYHAGDRESSTIGSPLSTRLGPPSPYLPVPSRARTEPEDDLRSDSSVTTSHTSYTSHSCPDCPRAFQNKDDLRRHRRYHGGSKRRHCCSACGMRFVHPKDLRRHQDTHEATKPGHQCPAHDCTAVIGRLDNLRRHIAKQHPGLNVEVHHLSQSAI